MPGRTWWRGGVNSDLARLAGWVWQGRACCTKLGVFGPPRKNIGRRKTEFEDPLVLDNTRVASWQVHARVALLLYAGSGVLGDSGAVGCSHTNARTNNSLYEKTHAMCLANTTRTIARLQCSTLVVSDNDDTPIESGTRAPAETQDTSVRSFSETREEERSELFVIAVVVAMLRRSEALSIDLETASRVSALLTATRNCRA